MNIAIIDDLQEDRIKAVNSLKKFFSQYGTSDSVVIHEFESGEAFLENLHPKQYQFIFLDYYMDGISGLETARRIRETDQQVILIFITASRDFAVEGYRVRASGYLVKPFEYMDFQEIMNLLDIKKILGQQYIEIENGNECCKILLSDIICCDVDGHYVRIHTHRMGLLKFRMAFSKLEERLAPFKQFLSCYRGCVINMARVKKMEELNFLMDNGERFPFRKKEQQQFKKIYTDYLFEKVRESKG